MVRFLDIQDHNSKNIQSKSFKLGMLSTNSLRKIMYDDCYFWPHCWPPNSLIIFGKFVKRCIYQMIFYTNTRRLQILQIAERETLNPKDKSAHHTKLSYTIVELQWRSQPQLPEIGLFANLTFFHNLKFYTF